MTVNSSEIKGIRNVIHVLKLLKSVLHESLDYEITSDEHLLRASEELDIVVNGEKLFSVPGSPCTCHVNH
ncbi:U-box domain-containing protein 3-like [Iris pallida]|uniref:U-box domain-containing protein 3-like n=1 Tax=Iris pallida TaxID=29817 RepID=A0AAX6HFV6_IRIPA|nr:U-box domain-containing protein 3-like [Iris pallida]KAJ6843000.1 U-box domain-containing protein 3-like [Iris pallida]